MHAAANPAIAPVITRWCAYDKNYRAVSREVVSACQGFLRDYGAVHTQEKQFWCEPRRMTCPPVDQSTKGTSWTRPWDELARSIILKLALEAHEYEQDGWSFKFVELRLGIRTLQRISVLAN